MWTRVGVEPRSCDQGYRKNQAFALTALLPTWSGSNYLKNFSVLTETLLFQSKILLLYPKN